jgi:hypothetical protein
VTLFVADFQQFPKIKQKLLFDVGYLKKQNKNAIFSRKNEQKIQFINQSIISFHLLLVDVIRQRRVILAKGRTNANPLSLINHAKA